MSYAVVEDRCASFDLGRSGILSRGGKLTVRLGKTALMFACEKGDIEAARLLVEKGADVNAQTKSAANRVFLVTR